MFSCSHVLMFSCSGPDRPPFSAQVFQRRENDKLKRKYFKWKRNGIQRKERYLMIQQSALNHHSFYRVSTQWWNISERFLSLNRRLCCFYFELTVMFINIVILCNIAITMLTCQEVFVRVCERESEGECVCVCVCVCTSCMDCSVLWNP